jgi:hypothetical protein
MAPKEVAMSTMKRNGTMQSLRAGVAGLLALLAICAATGPASADVTSVTINPTATLAKAGGASVTVSGTLTCIHGWNDIWVQVYQDQGQQTVFGNAYIGLPAAFVQPQGWIVTVPAIGPGFRGGNANVLVTVINCDYDSCNQIDKAATVKLHPQ